MDIDRLNVRIADGNPKTQVIIRQVEGEDPTILPAEEPAKLNIKKGTIGVIAEFLQKRWNMEDQIDHERTHLMVYREECRMVLVTNEDSERNSQSVEGVLQFSRQYEAFGINNAEKGWDPIELGQFFKFYKTYFEDKSENMKLVSELKAFKATVNTNIDRYVKENGSVQDNYSAIVDSTLPQAFTIHIPIFKGESPESLNVEIYSKVSGRDVTLYLMSSDAISTIEDVRDRRIDSELEKIREIAPEIPILEM